ncbi:conserved hypothetical protein, partial [Trichinella spiralis]
GDCPTLIGTVLNGSVSKFPLSKCPVC